MFFFSFCVFSLLIKWYRHLYAIYCLVQRQLQNKVESEPNGITPPSPTTRTEPLYKVSKMPSIFTDSGWALLSTSIISTSNCGNPALRLFGFGPVAADGYGIGYIIKEDGISVYAPTPFPSMRNVADRTGLCSCGSSKHLQTRRFLDTLQGYLLDMQRVLIQLHRSANQRPAPFVDHAGILRDSKTGRPIHGATSDSSDGEDEEFALRMSCSSNSDVGLVLMNIIQLDIHSLMLARLLYWAVRRIRRSLILVRFHSDSSFWIRLI